MNAVSGIYMITCLITGKSYIGKTEGYIKTRVMVHLNGKSPKCRRLYRSIKKHGKENFTWEVLHESVIPELLSAFEMEAIRIHKTKVPHGYNLTDGGETGHQSEETVRKRTETLRANPPMLGKKHSEESKQKMSESRTGLKRTKEQRRNLSQSLMGHEVSNETRAKIGDANRGRKWSDEARKACSERTSGEGNPRFGATPSKETCQKISDAQQKKVEPIRQLFYSLPFDMPLREKRKHLYDAFPDAKRETIQNWVLRWLRLPCLPNGEPNPLYDISDTTTLPEKEPAREFFFFLPSDMNIKEKRQSLYTKFPNVKQSTIAEWIRKWTNYKPCEEGSRHSAEFHQAHEKFLSLPPEMSVVEKRLFLHNHFKDIENGMISRWIRQWTNITGSQPTHPDYERAHKFFLALPSDMAISRKRSSIRIKFPNIGKSTLTKWLKAWTGSVAPTGSPCHPNRPEIHDYFLSMPPTLNISEKRKRIHNKFEGVVHRPLLNRWTRKWQSES